MYLRNQTVTEYNDFFNKKQRGQGGHPITNSLLKKFLFTVKMSRVKK